MALNANMCTSSEEVIIFPTMSHTDNLKSYSDNTLWSNFTSFLDSLHMLLWEWFPCYLASYYISVICKQLCSSADVEKEDSWEWIA